MDFIIDTFFVFFQASYYTFLAVITAILPWGVLPKKDVKGQKVLITGSGSGIGRELAYRFGKLGSEIILWDINDQANEETLKQLLSQGVKATTYQVDLSSADEINRTADQVKAEIGNVDILINNAGIASARLIINTSEEFIEKSFAINAKALFHTTRNFLGSMMENNHGHIVTLASMAGKVPSAGLSAYTASKHAAVGFHGSVADEVLVLGKSGIKTTLVCPYYVKTPMFTVQASSRFPSIFPILEVDYVADRIVEAILTNAELLVMPKACYSILVNLNILPTQVQRLLGHYLGLSQHLKTSLTKEE